TMDVVAKTLFGADVGRASEQVGRAMEVVNHFFAKSLAEVIPVPLWLPLPGNRRFHRAIAQIDAIVYQMIAEHRSRLDSRRPSDGAGTSGQHDDAALLTALLAARDDAGAAMSDRQLRDECVTLFLAGHETTALALVHALYWLARRPEICERFNQELDSVLGQRQPGWDDVAALDLTGRVIKEAMRLYPPVWSIGREVTEAFEVAGYRLPVGAQIVASQWVVHRDPRWFPDPETFEPDRWLPERCGQLPRYAYFPFGLGPRICIGNHFATTEAILLLAQIGQRFRVEPLSREPLVFTPSVTLRPRGDGLRVRLRAR
ncbi:MAG: cytochrome P450, partial [Myxococcota bacterium]